MIGVHGQHVRNPGGDGDAGSGPVDPVHRFPQRVHMSDRPTTLGKRGGFPLFHSPYYY